MHDIAVTLRAAQFYAHNAHNLARGPNFFADHEFFGELYAAYESAYDSVVERMIGTGVPVDLPELTCEASTKHKDDWTQPEGSSDKAFRQLLMAERELCKAIDACCEGMPGPKPEGEDEAEEGGVSEGTETLLLELYNDSEVRQYKLRQRVAK